MTSKNKYWNRSHISEAKTRHLLKEFSYDSTATEASNRTEISRVTVNRFYALLRDRILLLAHKESLEISGEETEIDESYFGAKRVRGLRGRGARGKIPVFGLLKRGGKVYTQIVKNCSRAELLPIIQGKVLTGSTVYSNGWKSYDGLIYNYDHYRVHHGENEFARGRNHINGIESFWSWAKRRLLKFNGLKRSHFALHLKECEWRFNHRHEDVYTILMKELRKRPLGYE